MKSLIFLLVFFIYVYSERTYLQEDRYIYWQTGNPNKGPYYGQPEQIHLSLGDSISEISITWLTFDDTKSSFVEFGITMPPFTKKVQSKISRFIDGGHKRSIRYIHRATIKGIKPGQRYCRT